MIPDLTHQLAALKRQTITDLRARYAELFGEPTRAGNRAWLIKRIAWRIQALAEGDLSERARQRARDLACDADLRLSPPHSALRTVAEVNAAPKSLSSRTHDPRLPPSGTLLRRPYKGMILQVQVQLDGCIVLVNLIEPQPVQVSTIADRKAHGLARQGTARAGAPQP